MRLIQEMATASSAKPPMIRLHFDQQIRRITLSPGDWHGKGEEVTVVFSEFVKRVNLTDRWEAISRLRLDPLTMH